MPFDDEFRPPVSGSPAGSADSGIDTLLAELSRPDGTPPEVSTKCNLISCGPAFCTSQVADHDTMPPARVRLPFTSRLPTETIFSALDPPPRKPVSGPATDSALPIAPRPIKIVPCSGPAVPPLKLELRRTLSATTLSLEIMIGPSGMFADLMVIWSKCRDMT